MKLQTPLKFIFLFRSPFKKESSKKWHVGRVVGRLNSLKEILKKTPKDSEFRDLLNIKREMLQIAKHVAFMDNLIEKRVKANPKPKP